MGFRKMYHPDLGKVHIPVFDNDVDRLNRGVEYLAKRLEEVIVDNVRLMQRAVELEEFERKWQMVVKDLPSYAASIEEQIKNRRAA